jgi:hypothetical protein
MRRLVVGLTVAALAAAYLAGWGPERIRRKSAEDRLRATSAELVAARLEVGRCRLQERLWSVLAAVEARNYGIAQDAAKRFFEELRSEVQRADPTRRQVLEQLAPRQSALLGALAKVDSNGTDEVRATVAQMLGVLVSLADPAAR